MTCRPGFTICLLQTLFLLSSAFTIGHGQELDVIVDVDCSTFSATSAGGCMELDEALVNIAKMEKSQSLVSKDEVFSFHKFLA